MALSSNQRNNVVFLVAAGLTAIASAGYLSIDAIDSVEGPARPEEDEKTSSGDFYQQVFSVRWGSM